MLIFIPAGRAEKCQTKRAGPGSKLGGPGRVAYFRPVYMHARCVKMHHDTQLYGFYFELLSVKWNFPSDQSAAQTGGQLQCERSFSASGCTVSERRTALDSETVENILFVHSNA